MTAPTNELAATVAALTANARLRGGTPDYAASMAAGHTETFAAFEARTARRDLSTVVGGAVHRHDGQQLRAGGGAS